MSDERVRRWTGSQENVSTSDVAEASAENRVRSVNRPEMSVDARQSSIITPAAENVTSGAVSAQNTPQGSPGPVFSADETKQLRSQWDRIQVEFVDEPRRSVEQADQLVAQTMTRLAEIFADQRTSMEHQ